MWVQGRCEKGVATDTNTTWEKANSLYGNLTQKEDEGSKSGEFNARIRRFDNFRKRFGFKNFNITEEAASADQEAANKFPDTIKKITKKKGYLPEQGFMQMKVLYSGKNKCHKRYLLVRKRNECRNLREEGIANYCFAQMQSGIRSC